MSWILGSNPSVGKVKRPPGYWRARNLINKYASHAYPRRVATDHAEFVNFVADKAFCSRRTAAVCIADIDYLLPPVWQPAKRLVEEGYMASTINAVLLRVVDEASEPLERHELVAWVARDLSVSADEVEDEIDVLLQTGGLRERQRIDLG